MTPEVFERNRKVMRNYRINDNVIVNGHFGTIVDYYVWGEEKKVWLKIKAHTERRFRDTDPAPLYTIDTDLTTVEHV
jgi:hypothetical protein